MDSKTLANTLAEKTKQRDTLESEIKQLRADLLEAMKAEQLTELSGDTFTITINKKDTIVYTNADKAARWLHNNGYTRYLVSTIDTSTLNPMLKKDTKTARALREGLASTYVVKTTEFVQLSPKETHPELPEPPKPNIPDMAKYFGKV